MAETTKKPQELLACKLKMQAQNIDGQKAKKVRKEEKNQRIWQKMQNFREIKEFGKR